MHFDRLPSQWPIPSFHVRTGEPRIFDDQAIEAAIADVASLTRAIAAAVEHSQDLIDRRLAAIRRMHDAADRTVLLASATTTLHVLTDSRTPPLLLDIVLLSVLETGDSGAAVAHVHSALRHRYGRRMDPIAVENSLRALVAEGRVLDRGTRYFAPTADLTRLSKMHEAPTIKAMIVEALENADDGGLPPPAIREVIASRHRRAIPMTSIYPVIRQLEHARRVAKAGRNWILVDRSKLYRPGA
jgi:hypothetical protein